MQVIHSARANASHNHGLDPERLIVGNIFSVLKNVSCEVVLLPCFLSTNDAVFLFLTAEAFVGKGYFKKRVSYHARGRSGIRFRAECRLTIVLREITPEEEADIARLKVHNFKKLTKRESRLVPHQLIETNPVWGRKNKSNSQNLDAAAA